jgi:hypothetical protein
VLIFYPNQKTHIPRPVIGLAAAFVQKLTVVKTSYSYVRANVPIWDSSGKIKISSSRVKAFKDRLWAVKPYYDLNQILLKLNP